MNRYYNRRLGEEKEDSYYEKLCDKYHAIQIEDYGILCDIVEAACKMESFYNGWLYSVIFEEVGFKCLEPIVECIQKKYNAYISDISYITYEAQEYELNTVDAYEVEGCRNLVDTIDNDLYELNQLVKEANRRAFSLYKIHAVPSVIDK